MASIEEYNSGDEFDDDYEPTILPDPPAASGSGSAASTGGALSGLESMMEAMGKMEQKQTRIMNEPGVVYTDDTSQYKGWQTVYPIYFDAKRAFGKGGRRIPREKSLWWPLNKDIAQACMALHLPIFNEQQKTHPKDWANPGRVKVQYEKDGKFLEPSITNRKQLYLAIAAHIQKVKPQLVPSPSDCEPTAPQPKSTSKPPVVHRPRAPKPPTPLPPLEQRVSQFSPLIPGNHYLEILKNEREREKKNPPPPPPPAAVEAAPETGRHDKKPKMKMIRGGRR